jgi:hypothetical protein
MRDFENGCLDFFSSKDIEHDKQTAKILPGFRDPRIRSHINADRACIAALPFATFMDEMRDLFLAPDWEGDLCQDLMSTVMGNSPFWDYATAIQNLNILLMGTDSYLPEDKLRHQIEVGMMDKLAKHCKAEKVQNVDGLRPWLLEVKHVNDGLRAQSLEFEEIARNTCYESRKTNHLSEPSRHANTNMASGSTVSPAVGTGTRGRVPKLKASERKLLYANKGCLKCRHLFVDHVMANCPNNFPDPLKYKTITQAMVDTAKAQFGKNVGAITHDSGNDSFQSVQAPHLVAAVMSSSNYPSAYMPPNASAILEGGDSDSDSVSAGLSCGSPSQGVSHIIGAVLVHPKDDNSPAPLFLLHLNWDCMLAGLAQDFPSVTTSMIDCGCPTVLIREDLCNSLGLQKIKLHKPESFDVALHDYPRVKKSVILHDYCTVSLSDPASRWHSNSVRAIVAPNLCSSITTSMIDCGCPTVLIREDLCNSLGLQKRKLHKPESFDVALHDYPRVKKSVILHDYCTVSLSDPASRWHSNSVRAIVAPNLCSSIILGLPFLAHNDIVIDIAARTAIYKKSGFDLMNPGPVPIPPKPKMSPKDKRDRFQHDFKELGR